MVDCGARLWLQGRNPYTAFALLACLTHFGVSADATTPLQVGAFAHVRYYPSHTQLVQVFTQLSRRHVQRPAGFESHFSYPAGSFLFTAPMLAIEWPDISLFYLLCLVLIYALLAWRAPVQMRPWLVLAALAILTVLRR